MSTTANEWEYTQKKKKSAAVTEFMVILHLTVNLYFFLNPKPSAISRTPFLVKKSPKRLCQILKKSLGLLVKNTVPLDQPTVSNLDFKIKRWLEERKNCVKSKYLLGVKIKVCFLIDKCCTLSKRFFMGALGALVVVVVQILN